MPSDFHLGVTSGRHLPEVERQEERKGLGHLSLSAPSLPAAPPVTFPLAGLVCPHTPSRGHGPRALQYPLYWPHLCK